jgi:hypothetical protein
MNTTKSQLQKAIDAVNKRAEKGLNDDDQVFRMCQLAKNCKGYHFFPLYDSYQLVTDEHLFSVWVERYGYWSEEVKNINTILINKGGNDYMTKINAPYIGTSNAR